MSTTINHSPEITIREAGLEDAEAGARCQIACWVEAYAGKDGEEPLVPLSMLERFAGDVEGRTRAWRSRVTLRTHRTMLAIENATDRVVGFSFGSLVNAQALTAEEIAARHTVQTALGTMSAPPLSTSGRRELGAIYVLDAFQRRGIARALVEQVVSYDEPTELWVFEKNPRARAFYAKIGFGKEPVARKIEPFSGSWEVCLVREARVPTSAG